MTKAPHLRLLLFDDFPEMADSISFSAQLLGYATRMAASAEDFRQKLIDFAPTHVSIGLEPKIENQLELLAWAAACPDSPKVILISGDSALLNGAAERAVTADLEVIGTLNKPYRLSELLQCLSAEEAVEERRLEVLKQYDWDGARVDPALRDITGSIAQSIGVPIAVISIIDDSEQRLLIAHGIETYDTSRAGTFCAQTIRQYQLLEVCDASASPRFSKNPLVSEHAGIRYYVGVPLVDPTGLALGTIFLMDRIARPPLSEDFRKLLRDAAVAIMRTLQHYRKTEAPFAVSSKPHERQIIG